MPDDYSDLLPGEPQRQSRADILYNALVPNYLKYRNPSPMPPEGTPPGKIGPPSGNPTAFDIGAQALPDVLSFLSPGAKAIPLGAKSLGMFIGQGAKDWRMPSQWLAKGMEMRGMSPEQIHDETQLFKGHEGEWRQGISDKGLIAKKLPVDAKTTSAMAQVGDFIDHPELFKNYPQLQQYKMAVDPRFGPETEAEFDPNINKITLGGPVLPEGLTPEQQRNATHELQHGVQNIEGWQGGAASRWIGDRVAGKLADVVQREPKGSPLHQEAMRDMLYLGRNKPATSFEMYKRTPGETEARNVMDRFAYDKFNQYTSYPVTTNYDNVADALKQHGTALDMTHAATGRPETYRMRQWKTENPVMPEELPPEMRALYDRLPNKRTVFGGVPLTMQGDRRYPWKTEDIPRWLQFNYAK
jgi:hypothetical protein